MKSLAHTLPPHRQMQAFGELPLGGGSGSAALQRKNNSPLEGEWANQGPSPPDRPWGVKALLALGCCALLLSGCVTSRVEQARTARTVIGADEAMVLLGRASYNDRQTEASFTDCIADILARGRSPIRLVPSEQFKDDLYPWFEPRLEPTSTDQLAKLLSEPGVKQRVEEAKVRYIAWIEGDTARVDQGGSMSCTISTFGGGCFGMSYWKEDAKYQASIWDLQTMTATGQISADATGTSYLAGLVIPIPILARPGNAACKGLAKQLAEFMRGN